MDDFNANLIRAELTQSFGNGFQRALHVRLEYQIQHLGFGSIRTAGKEGFQSDAGFLGKLALTLLDRTAFGNATCGLFIGKTDELLASFGHCLQSPALPQAWKALLP